MKNFKTLREKRKGTAGEIVVNLLRGTMAPFPEEKKNRVVHYGRQLGMCGYSDLKFKNSVPEFQ